MVPPERLALRAALGLPADVPVVLVTGGMRGLLRGVAEACEALASLDRAFVALAVCGDHRRLAARLRRRHDGDREVPDTRPRVGHGARDGRRRPRRLEGGRHDLRRGARARAAAPAAPVPPGPGAGQRGRAWSRRGRRSARETGGSCGDAWTPSWASRNSARRSPPRREACGGRRRGAPWPRRCSVSWGGDDRARRLVGSGRGRRGVGRVRLGSAVRLARGRLAARAGGRTPGRPHVRRRTRSRGDAPAPAAPGGARRPGHLLPDRRARRAAPGRGARDRGRGPRDRQPHLASPQRVVPVPGRGGAGDHRGRAHPGGHPRAARRASTGLPGASSTRRRWRRPAGSGWSRSSGRSSTRGSARDPRPPSFATSRTASTTARSSTFTTRRGCRARPSAFWPRCPDCSTSWTREGTPPSPWESFSPGAGAPARPSRGRPSRRAGPPRARRLPRENSWDGHHRRRSLSRCVTQIDGGVLDGTSAHRGGGHDLPRGERRVGPEPGSDRTAATRRTPTRCTPPTSTWGSRSGPTSSSGSAASTSPGRRTPRPPRRTAGGATRCRRSAGMAETPKSDR